MTSIMVSCSLCGKEILGADQATMHKQVVGWEPARGRKAGGTNALKLRHESGALAHRDCVELKRHGKSVYQDVLF